MLKSIYENIDEQTEERFITKTGNSGSISLVSLNNGEKVTGRDAYAVKANMVE